MRDEEIVQKCKNPFFYEANKRMCDGLSELLFPEVREYLKDNPGCTMKELMDNTKVKKKYIDGWIMAGRLEMTGGPMAEYMDKLNVLKDEVAKMNEEDERIKKKLQEEARERASIEAKKSKGYQTSFMEKRR